MYSEELNTLLDSAWISNIIGISFALVTFLLGFPIAFMQTYVPEGLRKYHHDGVQNKQRQLINTTKLLLLPIIIIVGNHAIKYFINYYIFPNGSCIWQYGNYCIDKRDFIIFYYAFCLIYFIYFSNKIINYFKQTVFQEEDVKFEILTSIFSKIISNRITFNKVKIEEKEKINIKNDYILIGKKPECCKEILIELASIYHSPHDRNAYLKKIFELISHKLKDNYSGFETLEIYEFILTDIFVKNFNHCTIENFNHLLHETKKISNVYSNMKNNYLASFDSNYIVEEFIPDICILLINKKNYYLLRNFLNCLKAFNSHSSKEKVFEILYYAFEKHSFELVTIEIRYLIKDLIQKKKSEDDENEIKNKLIAYLALYYHENEVMKSYANDTLNTLKEHSCELQIPDFEQSKNDFTDNSKFDTANKIHLMMKEYFSQIQLLEKPKRATKKSISSK